MRVVPLSSTTFSRAMGSSIGEPGREGRKENDAAQSHANILKMATLLRPSAVLRWWIFGLTRKVLSASFTVRHPG